MVRFHWIVDEACSAFVPVGSLVRATQDGEAEGTVDIPISMEVTNVAGYAPAILTVPKGATTGSVLPKLRSVGVVLAHDAESISWKGEVMCSLAKVRTSR